MLTSSSKVSTKEPQPDLAHCSACNWEVEVSRCASKNEEESGIHYRVHLCPQCNSVIDDYDMSSEQTKKWSAWILGSKN